MSHRAALEYISAGRACGLTDHDIAARLEGAGWTTADVEDAFSLTAKMVNVPMRANITEPWCPPDNARQAPSPGAGDRLLSAGHGRTSALRYAGWIAVVIAAFFIGFFLMR